MRKYSVNERTPCVGDDFVSFQKKFTMNVDGTQYRFDGVYPLYGRVIDMTYDGKMFLIEVNRIKPGEEKRRWMRKEALMPYTRCQWKHPLERELALKRMNEVISQQKHPYRMDPVNYFWITPQLQLNEASA